MELFSYYDIGLKRLISFLFRICLGTYAAIICISQVSYFHYLIYLAGFVLFFSIFILLHKKEGWLSRVRLLNDFLFIGFILWGKDVTLIQNYAFLILPLINTPNHSGSKKSKSALALTAILYVLLAGYSNVNYWMFLPMIAVWVISLFHYFIYNLQSITTTLLSIVDKSEFHEFQLGGTHKTYDEFIRSFNESKLANLFELKSIICFLQSHNGNYRMLNSSLFISSYSFKLNTSQNELLNKDFILKNISLKINGILIEKNVFVKSFKIKLPKDNEKESNLIFVLVTEPNRNGILFNFFDLIILRYISHLLHRISKTIQIELSLLEIRDQEMRKIFDKLTYVNNSILAMHFIRNKLSPLKNAIAMTLAQNRFESVPEEKAWQAILLKGLQTSDSALKEIETKTNYLLESSNNPFKIEEITVLDIGIIIYQLRRIWTTHFSNENIDISLDIDGKNKVEVNLYALEIVFTDIFTNAYKHGHPSSECKLKVEKNDNLFLISVSNPINLSPSQFADLQSVMTNYNEQESFTHKSNGLKIVKDFLNQMKIQSRIELTKEKYSFNLSLKILQK